MKYAVNEEGIEAMNTMASAITESVEELEGYTTTVQSAADEYEDTLGPHKASLDEALSEITESVKQAADPANSVAEKLTEVAEAYEEIIGNDRIKSSSGKMTGSTAGGGAQLSSRSRKPTNNEPPKSGGADKISYADSLGDELTERTLFELAAFRDSLELGDGDPNFPQVGGIYGEVATVQGFERHHIPSNAVQDDSKNNLPL